MVEQIISSVTSSHEMTEDVNSFLDKNISSGDEPGRRSLVMSNSCYRVVTADSGESLRTQGWAQTSMLHFL